MALDVESTRDRGSDAYPLVAFETFAPQGVLCGLIAHYLESPAQLLAGEHASLPLVMRPAMARQLAAGLIKAANEAESRSTPQETH